MYHPQASLGSGVNESFARHSSDFSLVRMLALSSMNIKTLTRMTKAS